MKEAKINTDNWSFKLGILSVSLLAQTAPLLSVATPQLEKAFPNMSQEAIEELSSLPNLSVVFLILFSTAIAKKIGIKKTVMTGLFLFLIGGVLPAFLNNYWAIAACRLLMGLGFGLFNPFSVSMLYIFYKDEDLSNMLGYQNCFQNLGNAAFGVLMGVLVLGGWRVAFMGFAIAIIPLLLFGYKVRIPADKDETVADSSSKKEKQATNAHVFAIATLMLIGIALFMVMTIKLPSFVVTAKITSTSVASSVLGGMALVSMVSSSIFGKVQHILKNYIMGIALLGIFISFIIVANSHTLIIMILGVAVGGWFFGWVFPQGFFRLGEVAPKNSGNLATSIVLMFVSFGAFLSPIATNGIAQLFGMGSPAGVFTVSGYIFAIVGIAHLVYTAIEYKRA